MVRTEQKGCAPRMRNVTVCQLMDPIEMLIQKLLSYSFKHELLSSVSPGSAVELWK